MTTAILCTVAFIFVLWVILLKIEVGHLKAENKRLAALFDDKLKQSTFGVTVEKGRRLTPGELKHAGGGKLSGDAAR